MAPTNLLARLAGLFCCALVAGCATSGVSAGRIAAITRGETLARAQCATCHGLGATGASPWATAPAFRDMHLDANAVSYQRRLEALGGPHLGMPPGSITEDTLRDLAAYVASLRASRPSS